MADRPEGAVRRTPWKDRPDSFLRGYVAGSMIGAWGSVVGFIIVLIASRDLTLLSVAAPFVGIAAVTTFLWTHG